ncbi:riboflavin synthase alpha chain [Halothece sp. PCC 7418]|uniref:riboflavin synthase n=1 Tax=Halothece sp. (strain PCC 7418) TaxID=65093 RepID=UPI0002A085D5|nr:riboflavin synthase [Halothece sp. PCC 7418]AFZ43320.1 riboflavin synthase alpha chain [Halothece sp. PCC 7418]
MFTGLIQAQGIIQPLGRDRFQIRIPPAQGASLLAEMAMGDSVAVDGVCLTVESLLPDGFVATASPETLTRTTLGSRNEASTYVNIEPSLQVGSKLGGHFVTGHVDGVGRLIRSVATDRAWEMTFGSLSGLSEVWEQNIARYLIPKGSIAINGISLTIAECDASGSWFQCAVIPVTYHETNLSHLQEGNWVNLESDILGKYVNKLLHHPSHHTSEHDISLSFLAEHGYL